MPSGVYLRVVRCAWLTCERCGALYLKIKQEAEGSRYCCKRCWSLSVKSTPKVQQHLFNTLLSLGMPGFHQEHPVDGYFVEDDTQKLRKISRVDIVHLPTKVAIEVDGPSHNSHKSRKSDDLKDQTLTSLGWKVLRVKNHEIQDNSEMVVEGILSVIESRFWKLVSMLPDQTTSSTLLLELMKLRLPNC